MSDRRPAVFLDRDGVVNKDYGYVGSVENFDLIDGAADAIALLNRAGYLVFVVTNQSGIGQGYFTEADYADVTSYMKTLLAQQHAHIDDIRHCPFHPAAKLARYRADHHPWRKPAPGMILDLLDHWPVDVTSSFLIGDSARDLAAAKAAGIEAFLFEGGNLCSFLRAIRPDLGI
jgi:D-glycero-D-manno-heptose 1,7-bisphosphate phosphatase